MRIDDIDDDDIEDAEDVLDDALDLRDLVGAKSRGSFVEVVRMRGDRLIDFALVPPRSSLVLPGGCVVRALGGGRADIDGHALVEGDSLDVVIANGERVIVRFAPAPWHLLGQGGLRFALLTMLVFAIAAAMGARATSPPESTAVSVIERDAQRARSARSQRERKRRHRRPARTALRLVRRVRAPRARRVRSARSLARRRSAPSTSDGVGVVSPSDDVSSSSDVSTRARRIIARARGPPHPWFVSIRSHVPQSEEPMTAPQDEIETRIETPVGTMGPLPDTEVLVATDPNPPPVSARYELDSDESDEDDAASELTWSLVDRITITQEQSVTHAPLLEVLRVRGERLIDHRVLTPGQRTGLVRFIAPGCAEIDGAALVHSTTIRHGDDVILVRFAQRPSLVWTAADLAEERWTRKLHALAMSAGTGLMSLFGVMTWAAQYRDPEQILVPLDDDFIDVTMPPRPDLQMIRPEPEPIMEPEQSKPRERVKEQKAPQKLAMSNKQPDRAQPPSNALDVARGLPTFEPTALNRALGGIKAVEARDAAFKMNELASRGPKSDSKIGGGGGIDVHGGKNVAERGGQLAQGDVGKQKVKGIVSAPPSQIKKNTSSPYPLSNIADVVARHLSEIQTCYERALNREGGSMRGRVLLEWTIDPTGRVTLVKVAKNELGSDDAVSCMQKRVRMWSFPAPQGGAVTVVYPFVFEHI